MPLPRSRPLSPTGRGEYDVEPGHTPRSHPVDPGGATDRSHRAAAAHVRGERAPAAASPAPRPHRVFRPHAAHHRPEGQRRREPTAQPDELAATASRRRPLFDRAKDGTWLGLRGVKRAPASMTDIVPEGAKFIEGTYSNQAGSRTYKLFVPSGYQRAAASAGRHASRLHPVAGRFRRRHQDELHRRGTELPGGLSGATQRAPTRRNAGTGSAGRTSSAARGEPSLIAGITRQIMRGLFGRSQARLCRRPVGRRRPLRR